MDSRENPDLIKLKFIKVMRRKIFFACAALVVSVTAVVGVKAHNYYSMPELMRANLEALSSSESNVFTEKYDSRWVYYKFGSKPVTYPSGDQEGYAYIHCCIYTGSEMDGCRFSNEDQLCERARNE